MPDELVLLPDETRALVTLARAFLSAVRVRVMYPPEHPTVRTALDRLGEAVGTAIELKIAGDLTVMPTSVLVRGLAVPGDNQAVADMATLLHDRGVLQLGFDPAVSPGALAQLVAFAAHPPAFYDEFGGVAKAWKKLGDAAIRLEAVDYGKVLKDGDATRGGRRDDTWRSVVSTLSARGTPDQREQQRLLELAGDPAELAALAESLIAGTCAKDEEHPTAGAAAASPATQADIVVSTFDHLASLASVLSPERADAVRRNLASALARLDPGVCIEAVLLEAQGGPDSSLITAFGDEAIAELLAKALSVDSCATSRVAQVFDLLVPDADRRRAVLDQARDLAEKSYNGETTFASFWQATEELLLSYNDRPFVSSEYRAVLDGASNRERATPAPVSELNDWLETVGEDHVRRMSIVLLADLLRLDTDTERATRVLNQMGDLADDLLVGGLYTDALRTLEVIKEASARTDLAATAAQVLERVGSSSGILGACEVLGAVPATEWPALAGCFERVGVTCLESVRSLVVAPAETAAVVRAGELFVAFGESAVAPLVSLVNSSSGRVQARLVAILGRIGSPSAIPALQPLMRSSDRDLVQTVVRALGGIGDVSAARALHTALVTEEGRFRETIADALLTLHDRRVVPMLVGVLEQSTPLGPDYPVALVILDALGRLRDPRAVRAIGVVLLLRGQFLQNYLSHGKLPTLKRAAARALRRIGDPTALQALESARRTGDRMLRRIVAREASVPAVEGPA